MGNTCPSLQLALRNRLGQICRIRLWSNTLAATLSSSFYERHPDAIDCSSSLLWVVSALCAGASCWTFFVASRLINRHSSLSFRRV